MCELELPVDLFPVLAMHLEREDVLALSVSCVSAAKGLRETREPLVDWIVDRCVRLHGESPLASAVALSWDDAHRDRRGRYRLREVDAFVAHWALLGVLRALRARGTGPATCVDAMRALCVASARGYERAVDVLLEGDTPLLGLGAPCDADAAMAAVHAKVMPVADNLGRAAGPVTRLEAAYRALLETRSARIAARLLDWAPEVRPEHVRVVSWFLGRVHSLVHHACETRRAGVLHEILARRAARPSFRAAMLDRNDAGRRLDAPLHAALQGGGADSHAVLRALLDAGAWHSPTDTSGRTPLHLAAAGRSCCADACCVRLLLEAGADATRRDDFGSTPLHLARSADAARRLVDAGADPNARNAHGRTALHFACNKELVETLVGAGAQLDARDNNGQTPLGRAADLLQHYFGRSPGPAARLGAIEALVTAGADPFAELDIARGACLAELDVQAALRKKFSTADAGTLAALASCVGAFAERTMLYMRK
jgi:hypothetical protein